jgi:hypothetical protein
MSSLKDKGAEYSAWSEKEQEAINDYSLFQEADERATQSQMDRFFVMEKKFDFFFFFFFCFSSSVALSEVFLRKTTSVRVL